MNKKEILQYIIYQKGWCGDPNGKLQYYDKNEYPCKEGVCPLYSKGCRSGSFASGKERVDSATKELNKILIEEILLGGSNEQT